MHSLTQGARRNIARKVQFIWITRKALLPLSLLLLAGLEIAFVSVRNVLAGALESMGSLESFWGFWSAAILNTELHVLVVSGLLIVCAALIARGAVVSGVSGISSLIRRAT